MIDIDPLKCTICIAKIAADEEQKRLNCTHLFHKACIDQWLPIDATCPNCRAVVKAELLPEVQPVTAESEEPNPLLLSFLIEMAELGPEEDATARMIRARINRLSRGMRPIEDIPALSFRAAVRNSRLGRLARRIKRRMARLFCVRS